MKAIAIEQFGAAGELRRRGLPSPEPGESDVRIRVVAAGVSLLDAVARRGEVADAPFVLPWVPGFEIAGTVAAIGPACRRFRPGDRVMALLPEGGGYAESAIVRESLVAPLPPSLLFEEAAALPLDAAAMWRALFSGADPLDSTGVAFVLGASGGAGHLAVQLAHAAGARVIADAPDEHRTFVEGLGSVEWLEPGWTVADLEKREETPKRIVDCRDAAPQIELLTTDLPENAIEGITQAVTQRRVRPRLFKQIDIGRATEAHELLETGRFCGKLALTF